MDQSGVDSIPGAHCQPKPDGIQLLGHGILNTFHVTVVERIALSVPLFDPVTESLFPEVAVINQYMEITPAIPLLRRFQQKLR